MYPMMMIDDWDAQGVNWWATQLLVRNAKMCSIGGSLLRGGQGDGQIVLIIADAGKCAGVATMI
jgi:hypothetical protein